MPTAKVDARKTQDEGSIVKQLQDAIDKSCEQPNYRVRCPDCEQKYYTEEHPGKVKCCNRLAGVAPTGNTGKLHAVPAPE